METQKQDQTQDQLPIRDRIGPPRFLRLPEVMRMTGKARAQIYSDMKSGAFPKCFKIGSRAVAWELNAIKDWMKEKAAQSREVK